MLIASRCSAQLAPQTKRWPCISRYHRCDAGCASAEALLCSLGDASTAPDHPLARGVLVRGGIPRRCPKSRIGGAWQPPTSSGPASTVAQIDDDTRRVDGHRRRMMSARSRDLPVIVFEGPDGCSREDVEMHRARGLAVVDGFRVPARPAGVVCVGVVDGAESAASALLAVLGGAGIVVEARADRATIDRLVDDLRRHGPVDHRVVGGWGAHAGPDISGRGAGDHEPAGNGRLARRGGAHARSFAADGRPAAGGGAAEPRCRPDNRSNRHGAAARLAGSLAGAALAVLSAPRLVGGSPSHGSARRAVSPACQSVGR